MRRFMLAAALFMVMAVPASAVDLAVISGGSWSTNGGFPWVGNTNYAYSITTDGINGVFNQSNAAAPGNFNIGANDWVNANDYWNITMKGTVSQLPSGSSSWLQVGLITKYQADRAADWYASGMFNNAAFMTFGSNVVALGDTAGAHTTIQSAISGPVDYEVVFNFPGQTIKGRINTGSGWSNWTERTFGVDNWADANAESLAAFSQSAFLVNFYNENSTVRTASSVTFGDITVTANPIPEPAFFQMGALAAMSGLGLLRLRRRS